MALSALGLQFAVTGVTTTTDVDTRLNIRKRLPKVSVRTLSNKDNVNLAYYISSDTTPAANLHISDRSTFLVQNRTTNIDGYTLVNGDQFTLQVDKFLVTDTFTTETPTQPETPLFFYHKLRYYNDDLDDFGDRTLLSLEFADYTLKTTTVTYYYTDTATGKVYNNLESTYDIATTDFTAYYVKYSVKLNSTISVYHELISNKPVFTLASYDDIDAWGNLIAGNDVYLVEELGGGSYFTVTLPTSTDYAYKELYNSRLYVKAPAALDVNSPWYTRVTNGKFITSLSTGFSSAANYKYYLPEFDEQVFYPYPPYRQHTSERGVWLSKNLIKVANNIVDDTSLGMYVDVIIKSSAGVAKYAYTNDPFKVDTAYTSSIDYEDGVLSIDGRNGFIEVENVLEDNDLIYVTYCSEEEDYEFSALDFNPLSNNEILNKRTVFYVTPETTGTGELDKTLYYLEVNGLGEISYCSQAEEGTATDPSTQKLLLEDFDSDGLPKHTIYYDKDSTYSGLRSTYSGTFSAYADDISFIDKYTVESILSYDTYLTTSGLFGGLVGSGELLQNMEDNPKFLVLADVYVGESAAPENATLMDIRIRGGGLKPEYEDDALLAQPEGIWHWDMNHRTPYPGATAFYVEIPNTVLSDYGGGYTLNQLRPAVEKHMMFGGYPIIRTYGIDPVLTSSTAASGEISFGWPSYGVTYNVYYSTLETTEFTQHNSSAVADNTSGNSYTVSGLSLNTDYYVKISAIDSNSYEHYSPIYKITSSS